MTTVILGALVSGAHAAPPVNVSIRGRAYDPASVHVPLGANVRWTNNESGLLAPDHTVTDDGGSFDSGRLHPGDTYRIRFTQAGTYTYHCQIHSSMHGSIVVDGAAAPTATATSTPKVSKSATPSPTPTPSRTRKPSPKATPSVSAVAEAAPDSTDGSSNAGTIISVALVAIFVLIGLGYVVYLRFLRAPS